MKNLYILPTNKPSRLVKIYNDVNRETFTLKLDVEVNDSFKEYVNIYITSDEEIKEWFIVNGINGYSQPMKYSIMFPKDKFPNGHDKNKLNLLSVILTTEQDLIKDGVQEIDDEFLEWFIKNPDCNSVEVEKEYNEERIVDNRDIGDYSYKIIIPKEAAKLSIVRVYGVNVSFIPESFDIFCEDSEFMSMAESQGNVWSLEGFEDAFNGNVIDIESLFIRFIKTNNYDGID